MLEILYAVIAGIIQGITEWLPVSSTGHLILLNSFFNLDSLGEEFISMFDVVIQFGSIMAIVVLYFHRLNPFAPSKSKDEKKETWQLWFKIVACGISAGIIGILFDDFLNETIFAEPQRIYIVCTTLVAYGIIFIIIERFNKNKPTVTSPESLSYKTAFRIGLFQILALVPGTSRSGSTIIGSTFLGVSRTAAAEFSFFVAIPIMVGASGLKILKFALNPDAIASFGSIQFITLAVATVVSFLVSLATVKFLVGFVRRHSFEAFGWYRIALGIIVLLCVSI